MDVMGPLPQTENGHEYIVVVGDYFTKWTEAFALRNHTAMSVADVLVQEFIERFGVPRSIHSDQGREFESQLIAQLCRLQHMKKTRTTTYNPKSDGMVERMNRTVKQRLSSWVNETQNNWDDHLPYVMMAYRASEHESTKCSPNLLMLNRETNLPVDLMVGSPPSTDACLHAYVEWVRQASEFAFEFIQKQLKMSAVRQKTLHDQNSGTPKFEIGSTVWWYYPPYAKRKFGKGWTGPYLIIGELSDLCYIIQKPLQAKALVVHVDHLMEYQGLRPLKSWLTVENDKRQAQVEPPFLDQAAEEEVRLLTPLLPEPGNGPPESGPVEDI